MDEGVRMVATLRDLDPADLELELPVEVAFEPRSETITLPYFTPSRPR
jgi:hypothetical protein